MTTHADGRRILAKLDEVFSLASTHRGEKPIDFDKPNDSGWILYERECMHVEVNRLRSELGKAPVLVDQVIRAERSACGHVDYQHKFALGCRELVLGP